jgi:NhaP-type Na+/H+ and K+/H+ antiporter
MELELPTDNSDTLGGLVYTSLGRVPVVGDKVHLQNVEITVLSVIRRQIKKVKLVRLPVEKETVGGPAPEANAQSRESTSPMHTPNTPPYAKGMAHDSR